MIEYKVKQSRLMIILATVAAGIFEIIFLFFYLIPKINYRLHTFVIILIIYMAVHIKKLI